MELWRTCFNDTEEFIRFYFEKKYEDWTTVIYKEKQKVVASLQMLSYPMTCFGTEIETSYISGACTHPDLRGKGIMKDLLIDSFRRMSIRNIPLSTLIPQEPWLFDYYSKMGYASIFSYSWEHYIMSPQEQAPDEPQPSETELFAYFDSKMKMRPMCVQHPYADFLIVLEDLQMSDGKLVCIRDEQNALCGIAFTLAGNNCVRVYEILTNAPLQKHRLLQKVADEWGISNIMCKVEAPDGTGVPGGMARIINAQYILHDYASSKPDLNLIIQVKDEYLPENNGFYLLTDGMCLKQDVPVRNADRIMTIRELTTYVFGEQAFISLMLD